MGHDQLKQSIKQWNEEVEFTSWKYYYKQDNLFGKRLQARKNKVLEFFDSLNLKKGAKVLELGYGAGITASKIYSRGHNIIGVDVSHNLQKLAVKNCTKVKTKHNKAKFKFKIGNAEQLEFPDNHFDVVIGLGFLPYLQYPSPCIKESRRVLKPGGHLIVGQRSMYGISNLDHPLKWIRTLVYLMTNSLFDE